MDLYVCWGTMKTPGHPCAIASDALKSAGHEPKVILSRGWKRLPMWANRSKGRRKTLELTGNIEVPLLLLDDGSWIQGSREIADWAAANPAAQ